MIYKKTYKSFKNAGDLILNHIMGIGAIVGLLRFFLTHEFHNAHNNGGLKRMVEKHGLATGLVKGNEYLDSLGTELLSRNIFFLFETNWRKRNM